mmetsp:Transcript_13624/g.29195  ORF Transcript_13624/g.29195 Transcript_13624/m.29195 type:complete len:206 (-) Transcript_13624:77-694(-)
MGPEGALDDLVTLPPSIAICASEYCCVASGPSSVLYRFALPSITAEAGISRLSGLFLCCPLSGGASTEMSKSGPFSCQTLPPFPVPSAASTSGMPCSRDAARGRVASGSRKEGGPSTSSNAANADGSARPVSPAAFSKSFNLASASAARRAALSTLESLSSLSSELSRCFGLPSSSSEPELYASKKFIFTTQTKYYRFIVPISPS